MLNQADHRNVALALLDAAKDAGNRWIRPELLDAGLEPHAGVRATMLIGSTEVTDAVDVTDTLEFGVRSLEAHRVYLEGLGRDFSPGEFLFESTRGPGSAIGVRSAVVRGDLAPGNLIPEARRRSTRRLPKVGRDTTGPQALRTQPGPASQTACRACVPTASLDLDHRPSINTQRRRTNTCQRRVPATQEHPHAARQLSRRPAATRQRSRRAAAPRRPPLAVAAAGSREACSAPTGNRPSSSRRHVTVHAKEGVCVRVTADGPGGAGGYLAARIGAAGAVDLSVVARGVHLRAIQTEGLRLDTSARRSPRPAAGHRRAERHRVGRRGAADRQGDRRVRCSCAVGPLVGTDTTVVTFQNGIDCHLDVARAVGAEHVLPGIASIIGTVAASGLIRHTAGPGRFVVGEETGHVTGRAQIVSEMMTSAGVEHDVAADIDVALWSEFAVICATAGATAPSGSPIDVVREHDVTPGLFRDLARVTVEAGRAVAWRCPMARSSG